jgi:uncharacterized Zn finger protein
MQSKTPSKITWQDVGHSPSLIDIRLQVLTRQQRFDECLQLAMAAARVAEACVIMISKQSRIKEAIDYGKKRLKEATDALKVAKALQQHQAIKPSIAIAKLGLSLAGVKTELGDWLAELAEAEGHKLLALKAKLTAYQDRPTLQRYQQALRLTTKSNTTKVRKDLLALLRQSEYNLLEEKIAIFLQEKLFDDAMQTIDKNLKYYYCPENPIRQVMDAVIDYQPDWVVNKGIYLARQIIEAGNASEYDLAVDWLKKVKLAYTSANQDEGWKKYLTSLVNKHKPKYKLMGLLKAAFD